MLKKIFLGKNICEDDISESPLVRRWKNLKVVWETNDSGIERIVRLILAISQFIFIGTYMRQIFGGKSSVYRDLSIDVLVLFKIVYCLLSLKYRLFLNPFCFGLLLWFMVETILYIPTLIFASDYLARPRSYKRGMILFFINFIEINLSFAIIYSKCDCLSRRFVTWIDSVYFSFVTSSSTGHGDIYPITDFGKIIFSIHSMVSLMFVVLFLNIFSNKMEIKGYFDNLKSK